MKRNLAVWVVLAIAALPMAGFASDAGNAAPNPTTLTGEVIDLQCFMQHPDNAVGPDHAKCAQACMAKGLPIGFLADDGTVYQLIGAEHETVAAQVGEWAGKKCSLTGTVIEHHGIRAIQLASIADAVAYVCPMDSDVRMSGPGKCPKCGMALVMEKK